MKPPRGLLNLRKIVNVNEDFATFADKVGIRDFCTILMDLFNFHNTAIL